MYDDDYDLRSDCGLQDALETEDEYVRRIPLDIQFEDGEDVEEPEPEPARPDSDYGFREFHQKPVYRKRKRKRKH